MIKIKYYRIVLFIIFISLFFSCTTSYAAPFVGEDDSYVKEGVFGGSTEFYWTLSINNSDHYSLLVNIDGMSDLSYQIFPKKFVLSDKNPYQIVTLNVSIPQYPDKQVYDASIQFNYRELNNASVYVITKPITLTLVGAPYQGNENTILGGFSNPLPKPLNNPYGALILNILIWFIIASIVYFFIKYILHRLVKKTKTELDDAIVDIIRKPVMIVIIVYGIIDSVIRIVSHIGIQDRLNQLFLFFVIGIVIYVIYKIFNEILDEITVRRGGESSTFGRVLKPIFKLIGAVVIIIGGLIYGLSILGVQITALLAGAGVFGLVIAFAAQDTLSNFFSGIHLLLDRPFRIGDLILLESGEYCRVENVGMRSTKLYSLFDHELIIIPNNTIANQKIINIVRPDTKIRQRIEVGVAYGSDVEKVKKILYDSAANHPNTLTEDGQEPIVRFTGFGNSSLDFLVIFTIDDVMNQWKVRSDIVTEIDNQFRNENVTIPFPQRTVWFNEVQKHKQTNKEKNDSSNQEQVKKNGTKKD